MEEYADAMGHYGRRCYYIFFKSGFSDALVKRAGNREVRLITLKDMYEVLKSPL